MMAEAPPPPIPPPKMHRQKYAYGSQFWREFPGHGRFKGTVTEFNPFAGLYGIFYYDDGDSEDLTEAEIDFILNHDGRMPTADQITSAQTPVVATDGDDTDRRRSKRRRVSTIVNVNGYHVKAENNYTVKGGAYVYEEASPVLLVVKQQRQRQTATATKKPPPPQSQRKMAPCEVARIHHNNAVKTSIEKKQPLRMAFLAQHKTVLEPFMDDKTRRKLEEWSSNATRAADHHYNHQELFVQPELVTGGELRDYQLAGLNFLVDLHNQNVGMILGDEMGLVSIIQLTPDMAF